MSVKQIADAGRLLADYFLSGCAGDGWPLDICLAVAACRWPGRSFVATVDEETVDGMFTWDEIADVVTGQTIADLYYAETHVGV
jgi:hypothetical protein